MTTSTSLAAWGDSFTESAYPPALSQMFGYKVYNGGIGGETSTQIRGRFLLNKDKWVYPTIIWAGRNNYSDSNQVWRDIAGMVDSLPHNRYIILSVLQQNTEPVGTTGYNIISRINDSLAIKYTSRYLNIKSWLLTQGNGSSQDQIDIANGITPASLRKPGDGLHLNDSADILLAKFIIYSKKSILFPLLNTVTTGDFAAVNSTLSQVTQYSVTNEFGRNAGTFMKNGTRNFAAGMEALQRNNGGYNVALGFSALRFSTSDGNTAIGSQAGNLTTTGYDNVFVGNNAGVSNTTGYSHIMIGAFAGQNNTIGYRNIFIGRATGHNTVNGLQNTFIGETTGYENVDGYSNTFIGYNTGRGPAQPLATTIIGAQASIPWNIHNGFIGSDGDGNWKFWFDSVGGFHLPYMERSAIATDSALVYDWVTKRVSQRKISKADPLIPSYGDFYALMPGDNAATIAPGQPVQFPQNGPVSGGINRINSSSFNLQSTGVYQVMFEVSVTEPGQFVVTLNGAELPNTVAGRAGGNSQITGMFLITVTSANSLLEIRNPDGNPMALTISPSAGGSHPVSAHLIITKLQ